MNDRICGILSSYLKPLRLWGMSAVIVVFSVFGLRGTLTILLILLGASTGFYLAFRRIASQACEKYQNELSHTRLPLPDSGLGSIQKNALSSSCAGKTDIRMTGSAVVDEPLHDLIQYIIRDYVQIWYSPISADDEFLNCLHSLARKVAVSVASRAKEVDWVSHMTTKFVEDIINHLRLFKAAQARQEELFLTIQTAHEEVPSLVDCFFEKEFASEKRLLCRDKVCTDPSYEKKYLRELSDILLYLLLPEEDFKVKSLRYVFRELMISAVMLPIINLLSDPDYINQTIVWMCKSVPIDSDAFLTVIRGCDDWDELEAVQEKVKAEISALRSKDSGGEMDEEIKCMLSSLLYVQKVLDERMAWIKDGKKTNDSLGIDWTRLPECVRYMNLPLDDILNNNVAINCFLEFLHANEAQHYMYLYLSTDRWRLSAEEAVSELLRAPSEVASPKDLKKIRLENLRGPALQIFHQYLSERAVQRVKLDEKLIHALYQKVQYDEEPNETWFDGVQEALREKFLEDSFLPSFKRSAFYMKLLLEMDWIPESVGKSDDDDVLPFELNPRMSDASSSELDMISVAYDACEVTGSRDFHESTSSQGSNDTRSFEAASTFAKNNRFADDNSKLFIEIKETKIVKEMPKSFAVYTVYAKIITESSGKPESSPSSGRKPVGTVEWTVERRYSDFDDFHNSIRYAFEDLGELHFPGKRTFNNLQSNFLEERRIQLNLYLKTLSSVEMLKKHAGLRERLYQFLGKGNYVQRTMVERRVMDPLKSMKNVLLTAPETLKAKLDEMTQSGVKLGRTSTMESSSFGTSTSTGERIRWNLDPVSDYEKFVLADPWDGEDPVHMRILLVVLEEIFSVRDTASWRLRPRLVSALRHVIQAMFGNMYNRRLRQFLHHATSYEQVALYLRALRNNFWPSGSLALPNPQREKTTKKRTEVAAKASLLSFISDDLKSLLGTETTRKGILRVYDLFQYPTLNRRLVYVLIEGILEVALPANNLGHFFGQMHKKSEPKGNGSRGTHRRIGSRDITKSPTSRTVKRPTASM